MSWKVSETVTLVFRIMNGVTPVTGLVDSDFTDTLHKDGAVSAIPVTITEISDGYYKAEFGPNATGWWSLHVTRDSDGIIYISENQRVYANNIDDVAPLTPSGAWPVTISIRDSVPDPVEGVIVDIWDNGLTTKLGSMVTPSSGDISFSLPDGTYKIYPRKEMWLFSGMPYSLVVAGSAASTTITGSEQFIRSATTPNKCKIWGYLKTIKGESASGIVIRVRRSSAGLTEDGDGVAETPSQLTTNRQGFFEIELVRGIEVHFDFERQNWSKTFTVPDLSNKDYFTIT